VIEMKDNGAHNGALARAVACDIAGASGDFCAMSFSHELVAHFSQAAPEIPCGLTAEGTSDDALLRHERFLDTLAPGAVSFISYNVHHVPNRFTEAHRAAGLSVITWTVRDEAMRGHSDRHADQVTFEGFLP
jgi:glycerophosphoryl diester phosphodiesterase